MLVSTCGTNSLDELGLAIGIGVTVAGEFRGQLSLQVGIGLSGAGMSAEMISESEVALEFFTVRWAHVKMMRKHMGWRFEGFAAGNAEIASVLVSQARERVDCVVQVFSRLQQNVNVDDGLGGETRDGSAADVFDGFCQRAERL